MEMDEALNPIEVGLLDAERILLGPNSVADAVEQARRGRRIHRMTCLGSTIGPFPLDSRDLSRPMP